MDIKHSKAILIIGYADCNALQVVKDLTGTAAARPNHDSFAGLTHQWGVETKYYNATIPIWIDEVTDCEQWKTEFMKLEAKEVADAIGAWLVCFTSTEGSDKDSSRTEALLQAVHEVVDHHSGHSSDAIMLAVASSGVKGTPMSEQLQAMWEDQAIEHGFELVDYAGRGSTEYGELQGVARIKEALLAHEWTLATSNSDLDDDLDSLDIDDSNIITMGSSDGTNVDLKTALMSAQDETAEAPQTDQTDARPDAQASAVDDLDIMLGKLLAAREKVADLPEAQRKKAAAEAVRQVMNDKF